MIIELRNLIRRTSLFLTVPLVCLGQTVPTPDRGNPIAMVAGQPIFEQDLMTLIGPQLLQLHDQEYQLKSGAMQQLIRQKLIEAEAKNRGLSPNKLLGEEVDSKVSEPTGAEVEAYYLAQKDRLNQPFQEVKAQLQEALKLLKLQKARQDYGDYLWANAEVAILLRSPKVEVSYDPARVKGNPEAAVIIVEFADFQCPFCKKIEATLKDLLTKYDGRLKLAYRDFPLRELHPQAQRAAEASRCAGEQGKFWEFHDALLVDDSKLDEADLAERARRLGLDEKLFRSCLAAGKFKAQIEQDLQEGSKAGVAGTPTFFINGTFLSGAQPKAEFEKIIDAELITVGKATPRAMIPPLVKD